MNTKQRHQEVNWNTAELDSAESAVDLLDRSKLVEHLARGLLTSRTGESLITAIYGPWGSGKSWIKNRLVKELRSLSYDLVIVEFSPWQIRGVDELTLQFFSQVYEQIDPPSPSVSPSPRARLWAHLARLSGVVPAAIRIAGGTFAVAGGDSNIALAALAAAGTGEEFAKLVGARAEEAKEQAAEASETLPQNIVETRKKLEAFFNPQSTSRLLVIMDDFDRLTASEIQSMVRLIKANANFSGLNYLLLCDPEQLALALDDVASGRGREFLEKIVQNPIRLPHADLEAIFTQLCNGLAAVARRLDVPFDPTDKRLRFYFDGFLHFKLRNLRSVYRLIDALDFSTGALTREGRLEVDLIDLCAMDYLRLNMPALADWIHEQGAKFFSSGGLFGRWHSNEEKPKFSSVLPEYLREDPGVAECYSVLRQLFPSIESSVDLDRAYSSAITHFVFTEKYQLALRDEEHFDAYFVLQPSPTKIPEGVYQLAWGDLLKGRADKINFSSWSSNRWLISALKRLTLDLPALTDEQKGDLFLAFTSHADGYGIYDSPQNLFMEMRWVLGFMESLLEAQPKSNRTQLLERLFDSERSLFARMLFLENVWVCCAPEEWPKAKVRPGTPLMSRERVKELQMALAPVAESAIAEGQYLDHPYLGSRLYRWANSVGVTHTGSAMKKFLSSGQHGLIWKIIQGVARSISPQYQINFEFSMSYTDADTSAASEGLFNELLKFAERDFWHEFERSQISIFPCVETPEHGDACLIHHVRRALETSVADQGDSLS